MTIEDCLAEIATADLLLLNLFQRENGQWQANVYDGEGAYEYGLGHSPETALAAALHAAKYGEREAFLKDEPKEDPLKKFMEGL